MLGAQDFLMLMCWKNGRELCKTVRDLLKSSLFIVLFCVCAKVLVSKYLNFKKNAFFFFFLIKPLLLKSSVTVSDTIAKLQAKLEMLVQAPVILLL